MSTTKVQLRDKGWQKIRKSFSKIDGARAKVGVLSDAGTYNDGTNIALVAAVLHFGRESSKKKKKWPFITNGIARGKNELNRLRVKIIQLMSEGDMTPQRAIELVGLKGQALVKKEIKTVTNPALSEITIERKGSSKPLIDTGQLLNSISYETKL